jgi:uncharacterized protein YdeI (YjbR/CyaY-like superfamily)
VDVGETLRVERIEAWRQWLTAHHADRREIWLINDRKGPGRRTPDYEDLLDEAVCHGWVDVLVKGLDQTRYYTRWVPRRPGGNWTTVNRLRARRLFSEARMTEAGLASLPEDLRSELVEK